MVVRYYIFKASYDDATLTKRHYRHYVRVTAPTKEKCDDEMREFILCWANSITRDVKYVGKEWSVTMNDVSSIVETNCWFDYYRNNSNCPWFDFKTQLKFDFKTQLKFDFY